MPDVYFVRPNNPNALVVIPPLNLGYLSAALGGHGKMIDALRDSLSPAQVYNMIPAGSIVAITCTTSDYPWVRRFASNPDRKFALVIGGVHPTIMAEEVLRETGADYVVKGDGEKAMRDIVENCSIFYEYVDTHEHEIIEGGLTQDVDGFPDWNMIDPRTYPHAPWGAVTKNSMVAPILTSRGCSYLCTFCASPKLSNRRIRWRSIDAVIQELIYLNTYFDVKEFCFQDDNFTQDEKRAGEICERILSAGLHIDWACENGIRADKVDRHLLELMKKAGCYKATFGIESADNQILKNIKKLETIESIEESVNLAADVGIDIVGSFILGLPGETRETLAKTIRWASNSRLAIAQFGILSIYPGSELWDTLPHDHNYTRPAFRTPQYIPEGLTAKDLIDAQSKAFWKFYAHPDRFFKTLARVKPSQIKRLIKRLFSYHIV